MFYSRGKNHLGFPYVQNSRETRKDGDSSTFNLYLSLANANNFADLGAKAKIESDDKHDLWEMVGVHTCCEQKGCRPALHLFLLSSSPMFSSPLVCVAAKTEDERVAAMGRGSSRVFYRKALGFLMPKVGVHIVA
jgi:hypothetical protein